jgi:catechol 2,3-dioxygenase-like lactoylglutathione lyase family enzyme
MRATTHHHCGLRVTDIDRAARFYIEAFDGHFLATPFELSGDFAETVMEGPPGVTFKVCMVGFADGSLVELFEFVDPAHPVEVVHPTRGNIIHYGIQVDDVDEALARVEQAGGRRIWPEVSPWGTASIIYVKDPDENIIELSDASMETIVELTLASFPHADPKRSEA